MKQKKYFLLFITSRKKDRRTDAELALGCASGDKQCFNILAERYRKPLHEFLYRLLHSSARADDALQQTLLNAWLKMKAGGYKEEEHMSKWFSTIAYREAMLLLRREKSMLHPQHLPEPPAEAQDDERAEQKRILAALIAQLPAGEQQVIVMHDKMEMDYAQIGKQLGIRPSSVRRTHERAVNALKRMLAGRHKSK